MSVFQPGNVAYGFSQSLLNVQNAPIIAQRAPTVNDKAVIGSIWIDQPTNTPYIITSIVDNVATWVNMNGMVDANTFNTDNGIAKPAAGVIVIHGGSNINTSGGTNIVTVNLNNSISLPATTSDASAGVISIGGDRFLYAFPQSNTFVGSLAGNFTLNPGLATGNVGAGGSSLADVTTGQNNAAVGFGALNLTTTGSRNTALGGGALIDLLTGSENIAVGYSSGISYVAAESSNIVIGNAGVASESNVIRIGTQGSGAGEQNECFIAGIVGVTVSNEELVTINSATGQLGVAAAAFGIQTLAGDGGGTATGSTVTLAGGHNITTSATGATVTFNVSGTTQHSLLLGNATNSINSLGVATNGELPIGSTGADPVLATLTAGTGINITNGAGSITIASTVASGITTINGDGGGSATGATVTIGGNGGLSGTTAFFTATGSTVTLNLSDTVLDNTFLGAGAGNIAVSGSDNVSLGVASLHSITSGSSNVAIGQNAMEPLTTGQGNVAVGAFALNALVDASHNIAIGHFALSAGANAGPNIGIGYNTGINYTGVESRNICIGYDVEGTTGETNTTRIGTATGLSAQTACFIGGIFGVTVGGSGIATFVDSNGQLGTVVSSRRYKDQITDIEGDSGKILNLRPVTFVYKNDSSREKKFGLIAEEVEEIMPELVAYNGNNDPESVKYHDLPVLLLNELQKQHNIIAELSRRLERLETRSKYESKS